VIKINEIRSVIKMGEFLISGVILKGWPRKFCKGTFYNSKGELQVLAKLK
jgi:hypothetical protein